MSNRRQVVTIWKYMLRFVLIKKYLLIYNWWNLWYYNTFNTFCRIMNSDSYVCWKIWLWSFENQCDGNRWLCFVTFWFLIYKHVPSINLCEYGIISNVCTFTQPEFCFRFVFLQSDFLRICTYKSAFIFSITCISYVQLLI